MRGQQAIGLFTIAFLKRRMDRLQRMPASSEATLEKVTVKWGD